MTCFVPSSVPDDLRETLTPGLRIHAVLGPQLVARTADWDHVFIPPISVVGTFLQYDERADPFFFVVREDGSDIEWHFPLEDVVRLHPA
jgi:hypothetical protein